ncbi:DUF2510 domain-containing protein [Aquihabitans daechungensis]|uniref:DUF2510 domain-containing protein n=1 Tax=Aquihabitans daechungensis TaxID=1052257 RepID=UPI003BA16158
MEGFRARSAGRKLDPMRGRRSFGRKRASGKPPTAPPNPGFRPGWHPDPWNKGGMRWWDGLRWSDQTDGDQRRGDSPRA